MDADALIVLGKLSLVSKLVEDLLKCGCGACVLHQRILILSLYFLQERVHVADWGLLFILVSLKMNIVTFKKNQFAGGIDFLWNHLDNVRNNILDKYSLLKFIQADSLLSFEIQVLSSEKAVQAEFSLKVNSTTFVSSFEDLPPFYKVLLDHFFTLEVSFSSSVWF